MNDARNEPAGRVSAALGRLLCVLGVHDFRMLEVRFGLGKGNNIEKRECRRCGRSATRRH